MGLGSLGKAQPQISPQRPYKLWRNAGALAQPAQRGRPPLDGELLRQLAHAYLREAVNGPGLHRRLADLFDRPEPTIKDWIKAARERGYLSPAIPGRRAAGPGPLLAPPAGFVRFQKSRQTPGYLPGGTNQGLLIGTGLLQGPHSCQVERSPAARP